MTRITVLALLCAAILAPVVPAQEAEKPEGPQFDELSKKLFDGWKAKIYHLGRAGVKKALCKGTFTMSQMGQTMSSAYTYKWDGTKGTLNWDNAQVGMTVSRDEGMLRSMNEPFEEDSLEKALGNSKLTATVTEEGTFVKVAGETKAGFQSFRFDKEGVLRELAVEVPGGMGGRITLNVKMNYKKVDEKYLTTSQTAEGEIAGMGKMTIATTLTHGKVGDYHVVRKTETSITMGPNPFATRTMEYTEWKFNDDVDKPVEKKAEEKKEEPKEGREG